MDLIPVTEQQVVEKIKAKANKPAPIDNPIDTKPIDKPIVEQKPAEKPVVAEKPAEKPAEQKPTDTTEKQEVKPKKSIKDIAKPFKPATKEVVEEAETPEILKTKLTEREKKLAEYEAKLKDPYYEFAQELGKSGKSVIETLLSEYSQNNISNLTDEQIYERELIKSGVKPSGELDSDSTESSLEDEMDKFRSMPKIARDREIKQIKEQLSKEIEGQGEGFLNKLKELNGKQEAQRKAQEQAMIKANQKTEQEFNAYCQKSVGNEHYGVAITPEIAESIQNTLNDPDGLIRRNEDGSLSAEDLYDIAFFRHFRDLMFENLQNKFTAEGYELLEEDVNVTGKSKMTQQVRMPQNQTNLNPTQVRDHIHSTLKPV